MDDGGEDGRTALCRHAQGSVRIGASRRRVGHRRCAFSRRPGQRGAGPGRTGDTVYAALDLGHFGAKLWRRDGAAGWRELAAPAFPPKPEDAADDPHPWSLGKIWVIEPGGVAGRLWAGTMPGGLFRSDDGGESWALNEKLWRLPERRNWFGVAGGEQPGINSVLIDPRDPSDIRVGVSTGGLWASRDAGAVMADHQSRHVQRIHAAGAARDADRAGHPPSGALRRASRNRLVPAPQRRVSFGGFRRELARADRDPPGEIRLCGRRPSARPARPRGLFRRPRTSAASRSMANSSSRGHATAARVSRCCGSGLPQRHAYDLVWRHALDVDASGEVLAFGSTSGGVWISEDGGDSWNAVDARLPPVAVVRFAA